MDLTKPTASRTAPCSYIYIDALSFSFAWFAGIARYTARLSMALAAHVPVRFFHGDQELLLPRRLNWSQDQDLERWGRRIWRGRRRPLGTPPADCIGLYCAWRPGHRIFPYEVSVLHDFCPRVVPWAFTEGDRDGFGKWIENSLASDVTLSDSHSTKADAAWFSALEPERIIVAPPGPSLCVKTHRNRWPVARSERIGLVVSTIEPRKNAAFLFDWFQKTTLLPRDIEIWWVGKLGWMMSRDELERIANPAGGRRVRFLGNVSDARLCRLYQKAGWSIYPSRYEGFGFPILDSLRHGTPVLASCTSSMAEFDHPGVFFFDPQDPTTVDGAWQRLQAAKPTLAIPQHRLETLYDWDLVAKKLLDAHAKSGDRVAPDQPKTVRPRYSGEEARQSAASLQRSAASGPGPMAPNSGKPNTRLRIGIEMFGTQSASRNRGIGRYSRSIVATLLGRDTENEYVLYGHEGLPTDHIPRAANAVTRLLQPEPSAGDTSLAHVMERLTNTNPDGLDVLLVLNPLEMALGFDLPAKPLGGLKMFAVVYDLIPLLFQEQYFPLWPGPEFVHRYSQALNRLRDYDAVLVISEATRRDCLSLLGLAPNRVVTIGAASDGQFFVPDWAEPMPAESRSLLHALGITRSFVFSVGAVDHRKNLSGLIEAFAMLPAELRRTHQLVVTYGLSEAERQRVRQHASDCGLADQLTMTDTLSDKALRVLYQRCAAFVFPSSYEGFGLPVLEAMHCGAPVIAGRNSSQIEVVGDAGLLFNVADAGELAGRLDSVLSDAGRSRELRERAVVQARCFHWDETADKALAALTQTGTGGQKVHRRSRLARSLRPRIAFFSPLPPLSSDVSDYSARLLDELKGRYVIDLYHDGGYVPHIGLRSADFGCYDYRLFERNARVLGYRSLLYQMGNSAHHGFMYETMLRHPGIVTLHDLGIAGFHFWYAQQPGVDGDAHLQREFEAFCGARADVVFRSMAAWATAPGGMAGACIQQGHHLNGRIFERATAVIVHSPWCADQVRCRFPAHLGKTSVVALGATALDPSPEQRGLIRARFGLPPEAMIIASMGPIHATNMNAETIAAFAPLARANPDALLIFVGNEMDNGEARREVMELDLQHRVRFLGNHTADVLADLAAIADIGICLRRPPTNGETAAALIDFLRLGVPAIVSDVASFSCFPDSVVRKIRWDSHGLTGLTRALRLLAEDRQGREALGCAALDYVRQNNEWTRVADSYEEIIEWTVAERAGSPVEGLSVLSGGPATRSPEWLPAAS